MSRRLQQLVACWFVLQIVLPFTAPLQTLELRDLFGSTHHHDAAPSPESTTTPTISEASFAVAGVSVVTVICGDNYVAEHSLGLPRSY